MSRKPQKSTVDALIDQFDLWSPETQERVLDQLQLVHRLSLKRARKPEPEQPVVTLLDEQSEAEAIR